LVSTVAAKSRPARRRLDPDARRLEILDAAERVLRRRGTDTVRVEDVVREARAAKGTFYLYFASWEDLLLALRGRIFERFDAQFPLLADPSRITDWPKLIDAMAIGFIDYTLSLGGLHKAIFHGPIVLRTNPEHGSAVDRIAPLIEAGAKKGAFAKVDAHTTAQLLFAMLHEAVDAIEAGQDRGRVVRAVRALLSRCLLAES
jgi:AcrR family transcriptional regulator